MGRGDVVRFAVGFGVAAVVEEDGAAGETVETPVVDAAFVVGVGTDDVFVFGLGFCQQ